MSFDESHKTLFQSLDYVSCHCYIIAKSLTHFAFVSHAKYYVFLNKSFLSLYAYVVCSVLFSYSSMFQSTVTPYTNIMCNFFIFRSYYVNYSFLWLYISHFDHSFYFIVFHILLHFILSVNDEFLRDSGFIALAHEKGVA